MLTRKLSTKVKPPVDTAVSASYLVYEILANKKDQTFHCLKTGKTMLAGGCRCCFSIQKTHYFLKLIYRILPWKNNRGTQNSIEESRKKAAVRHRGIQNAYTTSLCRINGK
jgi:hypothetical protein